MFQRLEKEDKWFPPSIRQVCANNSWSLGFRVSGFGFRVSGFGAPAAHVAFPSDRHPSSTSSLIPCALAWAGERGEESDVQKAWAEGPAQAEDSRSGRCSTFVARLPSQRFQYSCGSMLITIWAGVTESSSSSDEDEGAATVRPPGCLRCAVLLFPQAQPSPQTVACRSTHPGSPSTRWVRCISARRSLSHS